MINICEEDGKYLETLLIRGSSAIIGGYAHRPITDSGNFCFTYSASGEFAGHDAMAVHGRVVREVWSIPRLYIHGTGASPRDGPHHKFKDGNAA
jgi:hypothetical protein